MLSDSPIAIQCPFRKQVHVISFQLGKSLLGQKSAIGDVHSGYALSVDRNQGNLEGYPRVRGLTCGAGLGKDVLSISSSVEGVKQRSAYSGIFRKEDEQE